MVTAAAGLTIGDLNTEMISLGVQLVSVPVIQDATLAGIIGTAAHVSVSYPPLPHEQSKWMILEAQLASSQ